MEFITRDKKGTKKTNENILSESPVELRAGEDLNGSDLDRRNFPTDLRTDFAADDCAGFGAVAVVLS